GAALGDGGTVRTVLAAVLDALRDEHLALLLLGGPLAALATTTRALTAVAAALTVATGVHLGLAAATDDVTLVDPHLDADASEGGVGLVGAVIDLRAQGVQRNATLVVTLGAAHLGTAQTTGAHDLDALDLRLAHGGLDGLAHRAAERHAVGQLLGDGLGDQLGIRVDVLDLEDIQLDLLAGELLQLTADAVGLRAAATDDDA